MMELLFLPDPARKQSV